MQIKKFEQRLAIVSLSIGRVEQLAHELQPDLALSGSSRIPERSRDPMNLRYKPARTTALRWRPRLPSIAPASEKPPLRLCCPATRKTIRQPAGNSARWVRAQPAASIR